MKSFQCLIPFARIPSTDSRPSLSPLLRQWTYTFYDRTDPDSVLFLRIWIASLIINVALCCVFLVAAFAPDILSPLDSTTASEVASKFLVSYPETVVPWLLMLAIVLTLATFALQSSTLSLEKLRTLSKLDDPDLETVYRKGSALQYFGTLCFLVFGLTHLNMIPEYFAGYKFYAGVVDLANEPLRTMILFMLIYVSLFQLFVVSCVCFSALALVRIAMLRIYSARN